MKPASLYVLASVSLALVCPGVHAQQRPPAAYVTGKITGDTSSELRVRYYRTLGDYAVAYPSSESTMLGEDGSYFLPIGVIRPTQIELYLGDRLLMYDVFIRPGDTLECDVEGGRANGSITIAGTPESINDCLREFRRRFYLDSAERARMSASPRLWIGDFVELVDGRRQRESEFFQEYWKGKAIPEELGEYMESHIASEWAYDRTQYLWKHQMANGRRGVVPFDADYIAPHVELTKHPTARAASRRYVNLLRELIQVIWVAGTEQERSSGNVNVYADQYSVKLRIADTLLSGDARDLAQTVIIGEWLREAQSTGGASTDHAAFAETVARIDSLRGELQQRSARQEYLEAIDKAIARARTLGPGAVAPSWRLVDRDGRSVGLDDLKGRLVYLEFWATNCAPCIRELPDALMLQKSFSRDDIAFVYVSLDPNESVWKSFLERREFGGIHVRALQGLASEVARAYGISGIPRCILIGRDGRIISANAPRPSEGVGELLGKLLGVGQ